MSESLHKIRREKFSDIHKITLEIRYGYRLIRGFRVI